MNRWAQQKSLSNYWTWIDFGEKLQFSKKKRALINRVGCGLICKNPSYPYSDPIRQKNLEMHQIHFSYRAREQMLETGQRRIKKITGTPRGAVFFATANFFTEFSVRHRLCDVGRVLIRGRRETSRTVPLSSPLVPYRSTPSVPLTYPASISHSSAEIAI